MVVIQRSQYMNFLKQFKDMTDTVKVLTGIRRSGKTFLMNMFINYLKNNGVSDDQIIHINFEDFAFSDITTAKDLYTYIHQHQSNDKRNYLFLDEVQHVENWEKAINSFRVDMDADIYITGSNGKLLSGELATLLTGRYVELKVYPLSFKEYYTFKKGTPETSYQLFQDYLIDGGFPAVDIAPSRNLRVALKNGIFDSIILSDIALRANTRNDSAIISIANYMMSEIGNVLSATKITNALRSNGQRITTTTVINYLQLLEQSFLFYKAARYDLRGKKWLNSQNKYYVVDNGLRNTQLHRSGTDNLGHQIENVVFMELLRRDYSVDVGKLDDKEIDFIARKGENIEYYQITQHLPENSNRETHNLLRLPDGYKKIVLTLDKLDIGNIEGINVVYVLDWLLNE
ncbi:ATP-binding protein [Limosilactobacillus sp. RRLNB_1_1]|uniref:ATP-binding protein n=1 Tax=Limosilactobacillus albertensis TaxID=2759752 RepID=A0A7W3TSI8_9LACO|nr:ATP-binding protein [Limosilactobacillus albertensis]MBB1069876.1 ATP-binding protein [Limosilactobacillus albertensis]MCD7117113.1 ATP-binding protein [Limosilactobacillus albertensis]MCD7128717.1 ATP-binding protein [Limosilactobacillus albertensis]